MIRMYVLKVLNDHIQNVANSQQPAKCIDTEGNVAKNLDIGKVCPLLQQKARKVKDYDQSSSHRLSAFCFRKKSTIRFHGRNLLLESSIVS